MQASKALAHLNQFRNGEQFTGLSGAEYIEFADGSALELVAGAWEARRADGLVIKE